MVNNNPEQYLSQSFYKVANMKFPILQTTIIYPKGPSKHSVSVTVVFFRKSMINIKNKAIANSQNQRWTQSVTSTAASQSSLPSTLQMLSQLIKEMRTNWKTMSQIQDPCPHPSAHTIFVCYFHMGYQIFRGTGDTGLISNSLCLTRHTTLTGSAIPLTNITESLSW